MGKREVLYREKGLQTMLKLPGSRMRWLELKDSNLEPGKGGFPSHMDITE